MSLLPPPPARRIKKKKKTPSYNTRQHEPLDELSDHHIGDNPFLSASNTDVANAFPLALPIRESSGSVEPLQFDDFFSQLHATNAPPKQTAVVDFNSESSRPSQAARPSHQSLGDTTKSDSEDESDEESTEESTTESNSKELLRKEREGKLKKIEWKIEEFEDKLKLLRQKRSAYKALLDPTYVAPAEDENGKTAVEYENVDALEFMQRGSSFLKYGRYGYPHFRHFELSSDAQSIRWYSSSKKLNESRIDIRNIEYVQKGQLTAVFKKRLQPRLASCSFSLIYQKGSKTLDVITKDKNSFVIWTQGLETIMRYNKSVKSRVFGGPNVGSEGGSDSAGLPEKIWVKVAKRNDKHLEERLALQPEPPRKHVERELEMAIKRFLRISAQCNEMSSINYKEHWQIKKRLVELEQEVDVIKESFHKKPLNVASHEIWRTSVELKALENKVQAIYKSFKQK